jgi:dCTP deaminase
MDTGASNRRKNPGLTRFTLNLPAMPGKNDRPYLRTKGVLPIQKIRILNELGIIRCPHDYPLQLDQFQPNSLDLRLGEIAHRVRCSFLPENETVDSKLDKLTQHSFSIRDGAVLEPNCTYIIPLLEELHLPLNSTFSQGKSSLKEAHEHSPILTEHKLSARTNPKSSTGRLDIFTRVITDYSHRFEEITPGYSGKLYLEVVPKSFPIRVRTGQRLNQLRVRHGFSLLSDEDILRTHHSEPFLFGDDDQPIAVDKLKVSNGLFMSVSLQGEKGEIVGYKAKKNRDLIDLDMIDHYKVTEFWDPIFAQQDDYLILEPEAFYIFASKERCRIPGHLAAEMVPYDTGSGELRTHYAGFFDSGFGGSIAEGGARAVLEVRSHDVPFLIEDGQTFFRMVFEPNTEIPELIYGRDIKSNYQGQNLKLSKHFRG